MVFGLLFLAVVFPSVVFAQQAPLVVINEIAWMGSSVEGVDTKQHWRYEWLELQNRTIDRTIVLEGWSIELYRDEELYFEIPLSGTIIPQGYFLVAASDKVLGVDPVKQQKLPYGVDVNYANLAGKLVNTGMKVVLKDNVGNVVDEVDATDGWQAGENRSKRTMERIVGSDPALWQTSAEPGGTPKEKNSAGFKEPIPETFSFTNPHTKNFGVGANKKDPSGSFSKESMLSPPAFLAGALALGSALAMLALRRVLARQS